jgi:hypothetical protein
VEFHRVFGKQSTQKLIEIFGGTNFYVPSRKQIDQAYRRKLNESEKSLSEETQEDAEAKEDSGAQPSSPTVSGEAGETNSPC